VKEMFGGLAFLICGHMAISASGQGGVLVHVDPGRSGDLVATTRAATAVMQGREMPGRLRVNPEDLASDDDLSGLGGNRRRTCAVAAAKAAREEQAEEVDDRCARSSARRGPLRVARSERGVGVGPRAQMGVPSGRRDRAAA
jgi:hypothetical protein